MFLRLARQAETAEEKAAVADHKVLNFPDQVYGGQLQDLAVPGLPGEGKMAISYAEQPVSAEGRHGHFAAQAHLCRDRASPTDRSPLRRRCRRG